MKLSDLVRLAAGSDPEIRVYREDAEYWEVFATENPAIVCATGEIVIVPQGEALISWDTGDPNPLTGKSGVLEIG